MSDGPSDARRAEEEWQREKTDKSPAYYTALAHEVGQIRQRFVSFEMDLDEKDEEILGGLVCSVNQGLGNLKDRLLRLATKRLAEGRRG